MTDIMTEHQEGIFYITLNRVGKCNAFDDTIIHALQHTFERAEANSDVSVIVLKANGPYFSAGADVAWMQRMVTYSEEENRQDALSLAKLLFTIYQCKYPTIAMVQGGAYGGGIGLMAACDIVVAADNASFAFTEVNIGLIPAVISPFVIQAIGERAAKWLFLTAEKFTAHSAQLLQLIHYVTTPDQLLEVTKTLATKLATLPPEARLDTKRLVHSVSGRPIDHDILEETAKLIAKRRVSLEGQQGLKAFLNKTTPSWK